MSSQRAPGQVRDAIVRFLADIEEGSGLPEIYAGVEDLVAGPVNRSSVRSYLLNNLGTKFERTERGKYRLRLND